MPFHIANGGVADTWLGRCGDQLLTAVDRRVGDTWTQYSGGVCPAVLDMAPESLGPGAERQSIHTIADAGTYRLRLGVARRAGDELEWVATSNAFTVR